LNTKIIIAFIGHLPPPFGGVAIMNESMQSLLKNSYNIISFNTSNGEENEDLYSNKFFNKIFFQIKLFFKFILFVKNDRFQIANLFVTTSFGFIREAIFILILIILKKKIIIHFHSKKSGEYFLSPIRIKILSYFMNKADKIIVLSEDHFNYFSKYFNTNNMVVIENFVNYKDYFCEIEEKVDEFLYVGRLSRKKGFFDLLTSISILKKQKLKVIFNIIGSPENDIVKEEIKQFVIDQNITSYLKFHGQKFGKEKFDLFKKCSYFIFPSHFENSPVVLKEAIASKMAIVSSNIEANNLILKNFGAHIPFELNNIEDLAKSIKVLVLDQQRSCAHMRASEKILQFDAKIAQIKFHSLIIEIS
jgi:glycosyltransferase involved in cell wall biosynthesis